MVRRYARMARDTKEDHDVLYKHQPPQERPHIPQHPIPSRLNHTEVTRFTQTHPKAQPIRPYSVAVARHIPREFVHLRTDNKPFIDILPTQRPSRGNPQLQRAEHQGALFKTLPNQGLKVSSPGIKPRIKDQKHTATSTTTRPHQARTIQSDVDERE